mmetsp:Transcript_20875/g.69715  ORF Transcript_20875/g.69715 Transcript_20875/m.69715 type:complete len:674 (-) Transcript_20875:70-2091(-)
MNFVDAPLSADPGDELRGLSSHGGGESANRRGGGGGGDGSRPFSRGWRCPRAVSSNFSLVLRLVILLILLEPRSVQSSHAKCELVLASWNPQKLREMMEISRVLNIRVRKAEEEGVARGPVTPADLVEDSKLKAMHVMRKTGKAAMADCAVLKVPVLRDAPGFEVGRWQDDGLSCEGILERLNDMLMDHGSSDKRAFFECAMTFVLPDGRSGTVTESLHGKLVWPPRGEPVEGAPFYSIFVPEGQTQTLQEMDFYAMAGNNHRQAAFHELIQHICEEGLADVRQMPMEVPVSKEEKMSCPSSLQDVVEYVRPPGTVVVNNEYIKPYVRPDDDVLDYPQLPDEKQIKVWLEKDRPLVRDEIISLIDKAVELHAKAMGFQNPFEEIRANADEYESRAEEKLKNALELAKLLKDEELQVVVLMNLAEIHGSTSKAFKIVQKALDLAIQQRDVIMTCLILGKAAAINSDIGDVDDALSNLELARSLAAAHALDDILARIYASYAEILSNHQESEKAIVYSEESLRLATQFDDLPLQCSATLLLSKLFTQVNNHEKAWEYREKAYENLFEYARKSLKLNVMTDVEEALNKLRERRKELLDLGLPLPSLSVLQEDVHGMDVDQMADTRQFSELSPSEKLRHHHRVPASSFSSFHHPRWQQQPRLPSDMIQTTSLPRKSF